MYQKWIETLKNSVLFRNIGSESIGIMLDCLKPKVRLFKQREIIVAYGDSFQGVGIIASGSVALTKETYSGNRIIMGMLEEGDIFGEIVAFTCQKAWPMTVIAQEDCVILFLPPDKITGTCSNACASHTTLITNMLNILSNRASMLDKKIEHISARNIRSKISNYLLDAYRQFANQSFTLPMKRQELADYLNIPRPSLSREMCMMRNEGIIEFEGSNVRIKDIHKMQKSAD